MTALAVMIRPTGDGWGVYLTNGRELARFRGIGSKWRAAPISAPPPADSQRPRDELAPAAVSASQKRRLDAQPRAGPRLTLLVTAQLVRFGQPDQVDARKRTANLLHRTAGDEVTQVDNGEPGVVEQRDHLGLRIGIVA